MNLREEFPLLEEIVFLDNAAGTLKPKSVVKAIEDFYLNYPVNPHSGDSPLGIKVHQAIADTRKKVATLLSCSAQEVIFTSGTTDSLNKVAYMLEPLLKEGDEIVLAQINHNSNSIPFIELAKRTNSKVVLTDDVEAAINSKTKIVSVPQKANSISSDLDLDAIYNKAKSFGAIVINDAAQAITTEKVSFVNSDIIAFSGNKLYGPTGIGVLAVKQELLKTLSPSTFGGGATLYLKLNTEWERKEGFEAFEAGTPNTAGIVGLGAAIDFFNKYLFKVKEMKELAEYTHDQLKALKTAKIHSKRGDVTIMFDLENISAQDVVSSLSRKNIYLRSGLFCAFLNKANDNGSIRCSLAIYNNKNDIDQMIEALKAGDFLDFL